MKIAALIFTNGIRTNATAQKAKCILGFPMQSGTHSTHSKHTHTQATPSTCGDCGLLFHVFFAKQITWQFPIGRCILLSFQLLFFSFLFCAQMHETTSAEQKKKTFFRFSLLLRFKLCTRYSYTIAYISTIEPPQSQRLLALRIVMCWCMANFLYHDAFMCRRVHYMLPPAATVAAY